MDYRIEAVRILLNEDCVLQRYYPLIPYREALIRNLKASGFTTKRTAEALSDEQLAQMGLPNPEMANLFRRFLRMYDASPSKLREIRAAADEPARELFLLPGVRATRAALYRLAGYPTLAAIAAASPDQLLRDAENVIRREAPEFKAPLPKEARTHIAVAKAYTEYAV